MKKEKEIYKENIFNIIIRLAKGYLYKFITKKNNGLFLKAGDPISVAPQIFGVHEEPLGALIKYYVEKEYNDFLIDIGANIGLVSCQNGENFKQIHMFEPNPLCYNILEVNTQLALDPKKFVIHKYGLGDSDKKCKLTVPKKNWGGAFIRDEYNSYSDEILAFKDGYKIIDNKNYFEVEVVINDAKNKLNEVFQLLAEKSFNKGVVKIDVEGYEESIILGILKSIPKSIKVVILFESWDANFDLNKIINSFEGRCVAKKMKRIVPWGKKTSIIKKFLWLTVTPVVKYKITDARDGEMLGDIILEIN
jgi:FkbM family methyltransferase